jgi:3'(2'), 5'-bisphosphate nucleotidase
VPVSHTDLLERTLRVALDAADAILEIYAADFSVQEKADASPVTEADERAEAVILAGLREITPDIPIVSEEAAAAGRIPNVGGRFWLVDPLDGTKEFIQRREEFTVNIALIDNGRPVLGVVSAPALGAWFIGAEGVGAARGEVSGRRAIACRRPPTHGLTVVSSRSHGDAEALETFLAGRAVAESTTAGSSLKFCVIATGAADIYPRLGRTMEWDTAAGDAVLRAAGGSVTTMDGADLTYCKPGFANPHFVATGLTD